MNEQHQARLLEAYLIALRRSPRAAPPPALDPVIADLARRLVETAPIADDTGNAKTRVWQQVWHDASYTPPITNKEQKPMQIAMYPSRNLAGRTTTLLTLPRRLPVTLLVAAVVVAIWAVAVLPMLTRSGLNGSGGDGGNNGGNGANSPAFGSAPDQEQATRETGSPTPVVTVVTVTPTQPVTATPLPMLPSAVPLTVENPVILDPETVGTATPVPMLIEPAQLADLPVLPVSGTTEIELSPDTPTRMFTLELPEAGVYVVTIESERVPATIYYTTLTGAGIPVEVGTATSSADPTATPASVAEIQPTLPPTIVPPVAIDFGRPQIIWQNASALWLTGQAGETFIVYVSAHGVPEATTFTVTTESLEPVQLVSGEAVEVLVSGELPFAYFTWETAGGPPLALTASGTIAFDPNLVLFDTDQVSPLDNMIILSGAEMPLPMTEGRWILSVNEDGTYGVVIEVQPGETGELTLSLEEAE